jgi:hypothetical protein
MTRVRPYLPLQDHSRGASPDAGRGPGPGPGPGRQSLRTNDSQTSEIAKSCAASIFGKPTEIESDHHLPAGLHDDLFSFKNSDGIPGR